MVGGRKECRSRETAKGLWSGLGNRLRHLIALHVPGLGRIGLVGCCLRGRKSSGKDLGRSRTSMY